MTLVVDALAAYRLTRLLTRDEITAPLRKRLLDRGPERLAVALECSWCAGMWVALGVVVARRIVRKPWNVVAEALALSAVVGLIAENLD